MKLLFGPLAVAVVLASCGGGSSTSTGTTAAGRDASPAASTGTTAAGRDASPATTAAGAAPVSGAAKRALPKPDANAACTTVLAALAPVFSKYAMPTPQLESAGPQMTGAAPRGVSCGAIGPAGQTLLVGYSIRTFGSDQLIADDRAEGLYSPADNGVEVAGFGERAQFRMSPNQSTSGIVAWRGRELYRIEVTLADNAPKPSQESLIELLTILQSFDVLSLPIPHLNSYTG